MQLSTMDRWVRDRERGRALLHFKNPHLPHSVELFPADLFAHWREVSFQDHGEHVCLPSLYDSVPCLSPACTEGTTLSSPSVHLRNCPHLRPLCKRMVLLSCSGGNIRPFTLVGHPSHAPQGHPHCIPESHLTSMLEGHPHLTSGQCPHPTCPHAKWMALPISSVDCKLSAHSMTWAPTYPMPHPPCATHHQRRKERPSSSTSWTPFLKLIPLPTFWWLSSSSAPDWKTL